MSKKTISSTLKVSNNFMLSKIKHSSTISKLAPIEPISPINSYSRNSSYNSIILSDEFYDKLSKLKKEYKRFYNDQKELEQVLKNIDQNIDSIVDNMNSLVEKYNIALNSLKNFDILFYTNNRVAVEKTLVSFKSELAKIGINISNDTNLVFDENKLMESIANSKDALKFLFEPMKGLIVSLYKAFRNIKIPKEDHLYYEYGSLGYNGIFTDESI